MAEEKAGLNLKALTVDEAAKLLKLPPEKIRERLARGLPTDAAGRINLIHYAAWLNKELAHGD